MFVLFGFYLHDFYWVQVELPLKRYTVYLYLQCRPKRLETFGQLHFLSCFGVFFGEQPCKIPRERTIAVRYVSDLCPDSDLWSAKTSLLQSLHLWGLLLLLLNFCVHVSVQLKPNHSKSYSDFQEKYISFSGISVYVQQKLSVA